jgi:hypothetical protein
LNFVWIQCLTLKITKIYSAHVNVEMEYISNFKVLSLFFFAADSRQYFHLQVVPEGLVGGSEGEGLFPD